MNWSYCWVPCGGAAFALVILNLLRTLAGRRRGWQALLFASLSFGALTMLCEYQIVNGWVQKGDISALLDVVPSMAQVLGAALAVGIFLNFFVLFLNLVKKD